MNHGSWTVALFSPLLCNRCGRAGSQSRPHDSIPVSPGPDFQPHGKDGPNVLLPDTLGEPDSQRARAPGPFFFWEIWEIPTSPSRFSSLKSLNPLPCDSEWPESRASTTTTTSMSPLPLFRRTRTRAAPGCDHDSSSLVNPELESLVCGLWSPPPPSPINKSWPGPRNIRTTHRWPGSRGGQRLWRPPVTTVSSPCHFGLQLARLGCVTVPCYLLVRLAPTHAGGGRWTVVGKGLGSRLGELGVLTFASARRGIVPFLVKTMRPLRAPPPALGTVWPRSHASRPPAVQRDRLPGGIDFTPRHRISTTFPSHQKRRGGQAASLSSAHSPTTTDTTLQHLSPRQQVGSGRGICDRQRHQLGGRGAGSCKTLTS